MRFFTRSSSLEDPSSPTSPPVPPQTASASTALKSTYSYINPLPLPPIPTQANITPPKPGLSILLPTIPYPITTPTSTSPTTPLKTSQTSKNDGEGSSVFTQPQTQTQTRASSVFTPSLHTSEKSRRLLEVYDPRVSRPDEVLAGKEMVMRWVVEDFLWCAVRVQRHGWVLGAGSEVFGELKTVERWDIIHTDIQRYVQALATYEHLSSQEPKTHLLDLCSLTTWRQIHRLGRTLATLECAHHHLSKPYNESYESFEPTIQELTHSLSTSITALCNSALNNNNSNNNNKTKTLPFQIQERKSSQTRSTRIVPRSTIATLAGCALLIPVLLIVLGSEMVCGLFTTSSFAVAVGVVLACRLREGEREDVGRVVVVYLGVWMVLQVFEYGAGVGVSVSV